MKEPRIYYFGRETEHETGVVIAATTVVANRLYVGLSYCIPSDKFNKEFGRNIAIGRMNKIMFEDQNLMYFSEKKINKINKSRNRFATDFNGDTIKDLTTKYNIMATNNRVPKSFRGKYLLDTGKIVSGEKVYETV